MLKLFDRCGLMLDKVFIIKKVFSGGTYVIIYYGKDEEQGISRLSSSYIIENGINYIDLR